MAIGMATDAHRHRHREDDDEGKERVGDQLPMTGKVLPARVISSGPERSAPAPARTADLEDKMSSHALSLFGIAIPAGLLFAGSTVLFSKRRSVPSLLQLIGSAGLIMVVLTHFAEAFGLIPWMHWGAENSAGHYLDLGSAVLGLALFRRL